MDGFDGRAVSRATLHWTVSWEGQVRMAITERFVALSNSRPFPMFTPFNIKK